MMVIAGFTGPVKELETIADRLRSDVDSEICNSDSWENGTEPMIELSLMEAKGIAQTLSRIANFLERIAEGIE
jgi:uncharacterized protein Yka (UPF0111/DUF47 family)